MRHFVFMKFEQGYFDAGVFDYISSAFARLRALLPEDVLACRVSRNCIDRATNMDLMIELELKEKASLEVYLNHPLHRAIGERMNGHIMSRASFDCE